MADLAWPEIRQRILGGEDEHTEFKLWEGFPKKVAAAVCALANSDGGLIVLGAADDGSIVGVAEDPDEVQERLTSMLQTGLNAPVRASLGRHQDGGRWVHWIDVRRYRGPEPLRHGPRILVRCGRSSVEASPFELQELFNTFGFILTAEQTIPDSGPDDLDLRVFRRFLERQRLDLVEEPQPELLNDLKNRGVVAFDGGEPRLTLYGLLCFGREPQKFRATFNAWIDTVAYAGTDRASEPILHGEAHGRLDEQVERALGWFKALGVRETYTEEQRRIDHPRVPLRALREALVNAVVHRDYAILGSRVLLEVFADRVDVTSPGELPNHMTVATALAGGHPRSRNELLAHFMTVMGWMELRGRGLPIIRQEMRQANGTEPRLENSRDGRYVRLSLAIRPGPDAGDGGA
jgi:ATP-dependent DNA helicase RecG